jgi:putative membrane protein
MRNQLEKDAKMPGDWTSVPEFKTSAELNSSLSPNKSSAFPGSTWPAHVLLGMAFLCAAWLGPLPSLARTAFSPGMVTHLAVVALAAPLIGFGLAASKYSSEKRPGTPFILLFAMFCDMLLVVGWHLPSLHDAAARSWNVFAIEQTTLLGVSLAVWYFAFQRRENLALGVFVLFMIFMHMTILGCILAISPRLYYDPDVCLGAFGFTPLEDQRLGGVLMASWGAGAYLLGAAFLLFRMIGRADAH